VLEHERHLWGCGCRRVAGVDEAGRGPLAGPVVAAAVVFDREFAVSQEHAGLAGLTDSKQLSPSRRETFFGLLRTSSRVEIGVGVADEAEIDDLNILRATHLAMRRAVEALPAPPDHILVDGLPVPGLPVASTPIVGGDAKSLSIAAASVVAKVVRDEHMAELDDKYPGYGFASHKGYGSRSHVQAIFERGPSPVHRKSFRPVREAIEIRRRQQMELDIGEEE
jgi:ribonuclease HII